MNKSAIIIGGGLGGLFTGAILAKEGLKVTIVEKNTTLGGGLQSFVRFGEIFDTGMHIIGGMRPGGSVRRILQYLGIFDQVKVLDVDDDCMDVLYFASDKKSFTLRAGREAFVEGLSQYFPEERQNLNDYIDAMERVANELDLFYLRPTTRDMFDHTSEFLSRTEDFIAKYIQNPRLRSIVAYLAPLYGGTADMTPAFVHSVITLLYLNGSSRFIGGSQQFADLLGDYIRQHGGTIILNDPIDRIYSDNQLVSYVMTKKGVRLEGDYYISDVHPCTLISLLDNPSVLPLMYRKRLNNIPNSFSAFTVNIKLKPNTFKYENHTVYYSEDYDRIWKLGDANETWPCGFLYTTPPDENQGEYASKIILTVPMTWDKVKRWEDSTIGHRPAEYKLWKEECANIIISKMEEMHPGFRDCIDRINTASPLTIRDYYAVKEGSMYGFSKDYKNIIYSQLIVQTKALNLLLTGQCVSLHGFCGVPLTAIKTCEGILGADYIINKINEEVPL